MIEAKDIKKIRLDLMLNQKEFAEKLRVDKATVSRWERGEQRPRLTVCRRILRLKRRA